MSSMSRPTARSGRAPGRHNPSRSADAGSENRPAGRAYAGTPGSGRGRPAAAHFGKRVAMHRRNRQVSFAVRSAPFPAKLAAMIAPILLQEVLFLLRRSPFRFDLAFLVNV